VEIKDIGEGDDAVDTVHIHAGNGFGAYTGPSCVEIQKVYINTDKTLEGALKLIDYTDTPPYIKIDDDPNNGLVYGVWWDDSTGHFKKELGADDGYSYAGSFGTPKIVEIEATWIAFVLKTNTKNKTGFGDLRIEVDELIAFRDMDFEILE
jgi:hypothetical protein